jgi:5'-nucleotidase
MTPPTRELPPLILVTNDDGISSVSLACLALRLETLGEVIVAAPAQEQSAASHALTLKSPLRLERVRQDRAWYSVSGTPADAVLLALAELCLRPPALVVSGINTGLNLGTDVFYSGTLAGAFEGAIRGVQAMAVSQDLVEAEPGKEGEGAEATAELTARTAEFALGLAASLLETPLPPRTILSVNAPAAPANRWRVTRMGRRIYREQVTRRTDPRGRPYFWIGGPPLSGVGEPGTDSDAVEQGFISVTPLGLDLTVPLAGPAAPASRTVAGFDFDRGPGGA